MGFCEEGGGVMRFAGKSVLVTGAGSGIGRATALAFAREGAGVVCGDVAQADVTAAMIEDMGGRAVGCAMDAGEDADVARAIALAVELYGGIDVVHANAGISGGIAGLFDTTAQDWAEILRVNLIGPFLAIRHAAPVMAAAGGGAIVCTASVAGLRSGAGGAPYSASKAGVINLVQTAAQQLSGSGVRVNAVAPGPFWTPIQVVAGYPPETVEQCGAKAPLGRPGQPAELAPTYVLLASAEGSYITGEVFGNTGGEMPF